VTTVLSSARPAVSVVLVRFALTAAVLSPVLSGVFWVAWLQLTIDSLPPEQTTDMGFLIIVVIFWAPLLVLLGACAALVALRQPDDVRCVTGSTIGLACVALIGATLLWGMTLGVHPTALDDPRLWATRLLGVGSLVAPIGGLWLIIRRMRRSASL
jgi:hypothetical protein